MTSQRLPPDHFPETSRNAIEEAIREGYADIKAGRYFQSIGNFQDDLKVYAEKERNGWK